ncbi:C2H2 and C2HC zinc finger [Glarea lozoyensis ATCC 20868]|uniref:C2H2 and C2HC zinc finger n=1 Tax=Glarea lozoyensis (strain ATCC 20868 / MF5171) TaxID=1116229 RepID=S3D4I9_GLAL2|nr:C2H2 and C2HC zinc finger [Glarea lozoyensis ATCC 20868]EPE33352.1 C2H2 and C2HC zinc finger [Glarea lozoyensis ATCC 20868]
MASGSSDDASTNQDVETEWDAIISPEDEISSWWLDYSIPSPSDDIALHNTSAVFDNGLNIDSWMTQSINDSVFLDYTQGPTSNHAVSSAVQSIEQLSISEDSLSSVERHFVHPNINLHGHFYFFPQEHSFGANGHVALNNHFENQTGPSDHNDFGNSVDVFEEFDIPAQATGLATPYEQTALVNSDQQLEFESTATADMSTSNSAQLLPVLGASASHRSNSNTTSFTCPHPGCGQTTARLSDLHRHQRKHEIPQYPCPFLGCNRRGHRAFDRTDKLNEHQRRVHRVNV